MNDDWSRFRKACKCPKRLSSEAISVVEWQALRRAKGGALRVERRPLHFAGHYEFHTPVLLLNADADLYGSNASIGSRGMLAAFCAA